MTRDSSEYGWVSISRVEYMRKLELGYAGHGTPSDPDRRGYWVLGMDSAGNTCLWTGVTIDES